MNIVRRIIQEPAVVTGLVGSIISLVIAFGLDLSKEQVGGIMAVTSAVLALVTRALVTPTSKIEGDYSPRHRA